jgi:uncharacterized lipoprotein YmbA
MTLFSHARRALIVTVLAAPVLLAACSSTPTDQFYTLSGGAGTVVPPAAASAPLFFEMRPVTIPAQVRRPQMMVGGEGGTIELLEHHRWAGPLADEITTGLSLGIAADLGGVDVYRNPTPSGSALYRIGANVQRFESRPGDYALIDAVWNVRKVDGGAVQTCRSVFQEKVGPGYEALVAGHRAALAKLAAAIAQGVRTQAQGRGPACASGA